MSAVESSREGVAIDVLLCTFRRPEVADALRSVAAQRLPPGIRIRIVVADNDDAPSARDRVETAGAAIDAPVVYLHAPARNISVARNACLDAAAGDWVAFLDDDEIAEPDWLARLLARARLTRSDAVFGPALAEYGPDAPEWLRRQDHHSNRPVRSAGLVETGHTCNALLRWRGARWREQRFDLSRGRSGGEDTEFFFRLSRRGARFEIAEDAIVRERVAPDRLRIGWLMRRKFRAGQSHAAVAADWRLRLRVGALAAAKCCFCAAAMLARAGSSDRRVFWMLRGAMHAGVVSGCLALPQPRLYGGAEPVGAVSARSRAR